MDRRRSRRASYLPQYQFQVDGVRNSANIYAAYAGVPDVSIITPSNAVATMWWDEDRIEATVDRQFVLSQLRPDEQLSVDKHLDFGEGLTDYTYLEWIEGKAKRIFLILVDIGVPDQIFGVVDDSWDDDDLPIALDQVERLQLTPERDEKLERKFFQRQFTYLLRYVHEGDVFIYDDVEVVPIDVIEKRVPVPVPVVGSHHSDVDKVYLPGRPENVFFRRRIPFGFGPGQMPQEEFLSGVEQMRAMVHPHIASFWAAYVHQSVGYVLLTPVSEGTLKGFLNIIPPSIKIMVKQDRRALLVNWLHCLAESLAFLHDQGLSHRNIKPSNVMIDGDNNIFLSDCGTFAHHQAGESRRSFDKETYDYTAPEIADRTGASSTSRVPASRIPSATPRRSATHDSLLLEQVSSSGDSIYTTSTVTTTTTYQTAPTSISSDAQSHILPLRVDPQKSDVFSLGCIYLEILTILLKRAPRNFTSHRSAKNKTPGRGGGLPDSSFHKNLGQIESWIFLLLKDAKKKEDRLFRGVSHILNLTTRMLEPNPIDRPTAQHVCERTHEILTKISGIDEPHCALQKHWNITDRFAQLRTVEEGVFGGRKSSSHARSLSSSGNADAMSVATKRSSGSGSGSGSGHTVSADGKRVGVGGGRGPGGFRDPRAKPAKAKAWQAPVYAGE